MPIRAVAWIVLSWLTLVFGPARCHAQLTIQESESPQQQIRQVSLAAEAPIKAAETGRTQLRVTVRYLLVDAMTRAAIYRSVDKGAIRTSTHIPEPPESAVLEGTPSQIAVSQQISSPSRVTCCVLSERETEAVLLEAGASPDCQVTAAPGVILLDGSEAEMNDVIQHPFVVDMQTDGEVVKPAMHVLEDGTRLRLLASLADRSGSSGQPIQLTCEIVTSRVLEVKTDLVFGVQDQGVPVQVPIHQRVTAIAAGELSEGQSLLVDPHVSKAGATPVDTDVSMLAKIPYVGRRFRQPDSAVVEQQVLVLLRPSIEPTTRR